MAFSDTDIKELGRSAQVNIHNTRSLIRTFKYVSDITHTDRLGQTIGKIDANIFINW